MANSKTNFEYHVPGDLTDALSLLKKYGSDGRVVAGGTDLIPKIKAGIVAFQHLISLKQIDELKQITYVPGKGLTIGANVTLRTAEACAEVQKYYPALYQGMHSMANTQIRNRGTITGNICNAVPSADTAPALLVYGAVLKVCSADGERTVPITDFFTGVGRTVLRPEELITEIFLPEPKVGAFSLYYKYAIRKALDLALVGVAVNVKTDAENTVEDVRIALGAVAVTPKLGENAQKYLLGQTLDEEHILQAAKIASEEDCLPISDIRATAEYRRRMVYVHVRDALRKAVEKV